MIFSNDGHLNVSIYPVGLYRDIRTLLGPSRYGKRHELRVFIGWFRSSWQRRNYWNGYLCEPAAMPPGMRRCGRGLTQGQAYRDYMREYRKWWIAHH